MRRQFANIVFVAAALMSAAVTQRAYALGLDDIDVSSNLNQRFSASIRLTEVSDEDLETVTADVAPNEAFERAGIERAEYLSSLDFQIKNDHGQPRVVITSSQIAREPVLNLLVQASWRGGKILRDYSVLLDPAETTAVVSRVTPPTPTASDVVVAPVPVPPVAPPVVAPKESPKAESAPVIAKAETFYQPIEERGHISAVKPSNATEKPSAASVYLLPAADATGRYGPVIAKETLWSIATKVRPGGVSMDQVLLALSEANPASIQHATTVNKGAMLKVPSAQQMQAVTVLEAMKRLDDLRARQPHLPAQSNIKTAVSVAQPAVSAEPKVSSPEAAPASSAQTNAAAMPQQAAIAETRQTVSSTHPQPAASAVAALAAKPDQPTAAANAVVASPVAMPAEASPPAAATAPVAAAVAVTTPVAPSLSQRLPEPPAGSDETADFLPLALMAGLLLLAAGIFVLAKRRRKTNVSNQGFAEFAAKSPSGSAASDDTTRFTATQTLNERAMPASDATQQIGRQQQTQKSAPQERDFGATLVLEPQMMASLKDAAKTSIVDDGKTADFDKTLQVDVDTLQIDLNDNDPLAEADFHLAYGLYDEAIQLLQTAVRQSPHRLELQAKLVETYFAAGRAIEFQELAATLRDKLTPAEWSKVVIMGAQICPDVALFQTAADERLVPDTDFDLAFDDALPPQEQPAVQVPPVDDSGIEFSVSTPAPAAQPETDVRNAESSLAFMLDEMSSPASIHAADPVSKNVVEFDLGSPSLDIGIPSLSESESQKSGSKSGSSLDMDSLGFDLQELEFSLTSSSLSADPVANDFNTKLDLARAYVEMGDNDMARSLLHEVQLQGNANQQQEATSLLQRLPQ